MTWVSLRNGDQFKRGNAAKDSVADVQVDLPAEAWVASRIVSGHWRRSGERLWRRSWPDLSRASVPRNIWLPGGVPRPHPMIEQRVANC